jgi:hypothetical protein
MLASAPETGRSGRRPTSSLGAFPARFHSFQLLYLLNIRPLACMEKEFRILSSAIRRMISPAGKSICLLFEE